jgi:hypothetical protein
VPGALAELRHFLAGRELHSGKIGPCHIRLNSQERRGAC